MNISLGLLSKGYHLLEFEFVDVSGSGWLNFHVATASGQPAWLSRFRIYVPNYSDAEYRYNVTTLCNFPISDRYFIKGFADDYIDDIKLGGGWLYQDWQWSKGYSMIYGWGDGFNVPCGYLDPGAPRDIELIFGVISGGLIDFQILSFTEQPERIATGTPEFWAEVMALEKYASRIHEKKLSAGSNWFSDPGLSERKIIVAQDLYIAKYRDVAPYDLLWDAKVRFEFGVTWLDAVVQSDASFGIMVNLTYLGGVQRPVDAMKLSMVDIVVRVPSQALNVMFWEFQDLHGGKSIVNSNFEIMADAAIAALLVYASTFDLPVGAFLGLAAGAEMFKGMFDFELGTQETPFTYWGNTDLTASAYIDSMNPVGQGQSVSEVGFVRVKPMAPTHCGYVEVFVEANIVNTDIFQGGGATVFTTIRFPVYVP